MAAHCIGTTSVSIHSHHDRKTLEFEADPASKNVASNSGGQLAMKNPGSGVHATISANGNRSV